MFKNFWLLSFYTLFSYSLFCAENLADFTLQLKDLTLEQKIGQLFIVTSTTESELYKSTKTYPTDKEYVKKLITNYHVGGVIFLGKNTSQKQATLTQEFQKTSTVPLLIAADFEWGLQMRLVDGLKFPYNQALGALAPEHDYLIHEMGFEIGKQCKALGVHINFAPVVDVNSNPNNPIINDRSFGQDKERVAQKSILLMQGLHDAGVVACAKHFPGHGDTDSDSHYGLPRISRSKKQQYETELYPFKRIIDAGVKLIMTAHLEVSAFETKKQVPSSLSSEIVTKLLKKEMGFNGITITDGLDMQGVTDHFNAGQIALKALQAGNDILLCSTNVPEAIAVIKQALSDGRWSYEALDASVSKILALKRWAGCHKQVADFKMAQLHTPEALFLKRKLSTHALTIARDEEHLLPLTKKAFDTITCLQIGNTQTHCPFTTKLIATRAEYFTTLHLSLDAPEETVKDVISKIKTPIVIISLPEMTRSAKKQYAISPSILFYLQKLKQAGKKTIVVAFGNAYSVPLLKDATAVLVAYENDVDAQEAAARVIMGAQEATGILPV